MGAVTLAAGHARDMSATVTGTFSTINGATSNTYTTVAEDVGKYLRATASYTDPPWIGQVCFQVCRLIKSAPATLSRRSKTQESRTIAVDENSSSGTNVGTAIPASDTDGDTLTYTLSGTDSGFFTVASGGQIKTKSGVTYNFELKSSYSVTLNVHDNKDVAGGTDATIDASASDDDQHRLTSTSPARSRLRALRRADRC